MDIVGHILHNDENSYRIVIAGGRGDVVAHRRPGVEEEGVWIVWGGSMKIFIDLS
jgi:hypothetical protein